MFFGAIAGQVNFSLEGNWSGDDLAAGIFVFLFNLTKKLTAKKLKITSQRTASFLRDFPNSKKRLPILKSAEFLLHKNNFLDRCDF
ncbi:hypothetical protein RHJ63_05035 [Thermosynechococcus sp. JY1334]|uniref:hypothetical protein n=1 Tax=unclassified Thermosynechococcus TaxID=2622553 RepID=UPI00122E77EE|nr:MULTISPECIES: hypothetical protein [unclassified Thermosynechococcus]QEQ01107.1 hypothetical protein FFX45_06795 [Thermosynechococcus sp. CL-1]MDR7897676.1 hypothetical protein [Thermosynechococcus sp. JY1332]MDR7905074.1 hypothetical protein [Thermosynechococcus sp. JY1334]WKT87296.1 hypothetical protein QYC30_05010 [Thermosynechococcus sp. JY1339]WNC56238.1 hypothetical protein RHJ31_04995 [Thermosynechococcus sp. JY1331]